MPTILYIEDTETLQKMYAFGLEREGFTVVAASTAGEALACLQETHYDIVLLDLMLAGMSGLDLLKSYDIKTNSPTTKVVILTNLDNPNIKERVEAYRTDGYLIKADYTPPKLAEYLKKLGTEPKQPTPTS